MIDPDCSDTQDGWWFPYKDEESFSNAIDQLRQYFLINGILLIVTVALIGLVIILLIFFAGFFMDLINQSGFDYSMITKILIR